MTNTERKLDEARFFIKKLDTQDPHFDYFLSAFLNAARSTTWIMRNEFHSIAGWENWYNSIDVTEETKKLLIKINDLRILSTKQSGIKTQFLLFDTFYIGDDDYKKFQSLTEETGDYIMTIAEYKKDQNIEINTKDSIFTEIDRTRAIDFPSRIEMLNLCKEYLKLLTHLVSACTKEFLKQ